MMVLTLDVSGKVIQFYYTLSPNNIPIFQENYTKFEKYLNSITDEGEIKINEISFNEKQKQRLEVLFIEAHKDTLAIRKNLYMLLENGDFNGVVTNANQVITKISLIGVGL
ncbi:MAG: hypothetical protein ACP5PA_06225 [Elusimicrobiales bacterium]